MKRTLLIAAVFGVLAATSCKKGNDAVTPTDTATGLNAVVAPAGFTWESSRNVTFSVAITDTRFASTLDHQIKIYDGDPYNGGNLLSQGSATTSSSFSAKVYIPTTISSVYVVKTSPDNSQIIQKVALTSTSVSLSFGAIDPTVSAISAPTSGSNRVNGGVTPTSPDCSSGCTTTISTSTNNVSVGSSDVICITGSNITVSFANVNGGTVRVCGSNVTLQNYNFQNGSNVYITSTGSATMSANFNSSTSTLSNWGTLNWSGADNGIINNYGTMNVSSDFNINSNAGVLTNNGTMNVSGNFNNGSSAKAVNNGTINVSGAFQQNGGAGLFTNNCSLFVTGNYNQSAPVANYSYIRVNGQTTINSSTTLTMYNSSMFKTVNFILDGSSITGSGSTSLLKITGSTNIQNSGAVITGAMAVCAPTTISSTYLTNGASNNCNLYIASGGCNPDGNGTAAVVDTDGDGVPDSQDAFPNDKTKAYISSGGIGTVAFEDKWPDKGDFDMNDLVMNYKYYVITSASNIVVQVTAKFNLLATGGQLGNGFGVQFPIAASNISGLTTTLAGGTIESGQTYAVVTLFSNMRAQMSTWNTQPGVAQSATVPDSISFNVANGPSLSSFGQDGYNPFIWNMGSDNKRHEVHLAGKVPTSLANTTLFGTSYDNTNVSAGRYYVTTTGLPYAISVPTTTFAYPTETTDITTAYLNFAAWATSGGTSYTDWYSNLASGYRNTALIYTK